MKSTTVALALMGVVAAREVPYSKTMKREVPQEHSHEPEIVECNKNMQLVNTLEIQDCIFALLGNAAAAEGAGQVTNLDCLQMETADQAFTNAKDANDVDGMVNALIYRTLERNTGSVGLASVLCNETAVNPEIAALTQHQDPASEEGIAGNKQIELDLAIQIAAVGGDPQDALRSVTFAPGEIGDPTGAGNTCDDLDDPEGCIFSKNLDVPAATPEEIDAAVAAAGKNNGGKNNAAAGNGKDAAKGKGAAAGAAAGAAEGCAANAGAQAGAGGAAGEANGEAKGNNNGAATGAGAAAASNNIQTFDGDLGVAATPVEFDPAADRPFTVAGATFLNAGAALTRSCDQQNNGCFNAANSGQLAGGTAQCSQQQQECLQEAQTIANSLRRRHARSFAKFRRQASDFGSCDSPAIEFDGERFAGVNQGDFNHGSALNIKIITDFNCQRLGSPCNAPQDVQDLCKQAAAAATGKTGQAAADAFNNVLGA